MQLLVHPANQIYACKLSRMSIGMDYFLSIGIILKAMLDFPATVQKRLG
jgi:hypothetical protein